MKQLACLFLILAASGCPDIKTDSNETSTAPVVEFDPANKIIPFPNNLLLDPTTGKVSLPAQCGETPAVKALRENVLNQLDGFGLFEAALTATFSEGVDPASLMDHIVVYKRASGMTAVDPAAAVPVPIVTQLTTTIRFDPTCTTPNTVPQLIIIPRAPLEQKSTYVVALLDGIKTLSGASFEPSSTWRLVRGKDDPVTVKDGVIVADQTPLDPAIEADRELLLGIDLLWKAHAQGLKFLAEDLPADKRKPREQILLAWELRTQTGTDPLDPAVAGSLASKVNMNVPSVELVGNASYPSPFGTFNRANPPWIACDAADSDTQCYLKIMLGKGNYTTGSALCTSLACAAIGDVVGSALPSKQYQVDTPNTYTGTGAKPVPGPWGNPVSPTEVKTEAIGVLSFIPASPMPGGGYPVLIFQHALGRSKSDVFGIAGRLAAAGFVTVAIDAVAHDSRAVRISNNAAIGCADAALCTRPDCGPAPVDFPQCYAPFLTTNLAATRDAIRQSVLDQQRLVGALKACGTTLCGAIKVDTTRILYLGQSLGGILGSMFVGVAPDIKAATLNVPGVGWVDILENTGTLRLQCLLVDGLIDAGVLQGQKSSPPDNPTSGLCTTPAWKTQPGYRLFSGIGRWIMDPADPANFTRKLAARRFLIQQVEADAVVPKIATMNEGALVGLMSATADRADPSPPAPPMLPSAAISTNPMTSKWVDYVNLPADAGTGFPGNTFHHGSLLSPSPTGQQPPPPDGLLATARMQLDAIMYLINNR
jgi:dienelactone hydrolase